jgi:hypothetical protein
VFGRLVTGQEHFRAIEKVPTNDEDVPLVSIKVAHGGVLERRKKEKPRTPTPEPESEEEPVVVILYQSNNLYLGRSSGRRIESIRDWCRTTTGC